MRLNDYLISGDPEQTSLVTAGELLSNLRGYAREVEHLAMQALDRPEDETDPGFMASRFLARFAREVIDTVDEVHVRVKANYPPIRQPPGQASEVRARNDELRARNDKLQALLDEGDLDRATVVVEVRDEADPR